MTAFCREAPPEFTPQQREVFCVFSGEGVSKLRDFLNRNSATYRGGSGTIYVDGEVDEEEGRVTGMMNATAIHDHGDDEMVDGVNGSNQPHG